MDRLKAHVVTDFGFKRGILEGCFECRIWRKRIFSEG